MRRVWRHPDANANDNDYADSNYNSHVNADGHTNTGSHCNRDRNSYSHRHRHTDAMHGKMSTDTEAATNSGTAPVGWSPFLDLCPIEN